MNIDRESARCYGVTDSGGKKDRPLAPRVEEALKGGATCVQLREKELTGEELMREAKQIQELFAKYKAPFILNDDVELAAALGADGVQVATPFVTTEECDAADAFKQAYVDARAEDVEIIKSPVGMPARAIRNAFLEKMKQGRETITKCYRCLEKCNPREAPYCITQALIRSVQGDVENGLIFCGDNVQYLTRISTVPEVIRTLFA